MRHSLLYIQPVSICQHVFGQCYPLDVEIGFGHGDFLIERASAYPQRNLIGIEYKKHLVCKAMKRKAQKKLHNLHVLQGDACNLLATAFAVGEIHNIFINFPDPWWKKRHIKRRLFTPYFFKYLFIKSTPNARIFIQTDVLMTFAEGLQQLKKGSMWHPVHKSNPIKLTNKTGAVSRRERRCITNNIPIYRAVFAKST